MKELTLREVCNKIGITRRALQGYEANGLMEATSKNERGYLLYDETALAKIKLIKEYQSFGFSLKEIGEILDAPTEVKISQLEKKLSELSDRIGYLGVTKELMEKRIEEMKAGDK